MNSTETGIALLLAGAILSLVAGLMRLFPSRPNAAPAANTSGPSRITLDNLIAALILLSSLSTLFTPSKVLAEYWFFTPPFWLRGLLSTFGIAIAVGLFLLSRKPLKTEPPA